jgi:betaine-aldehyde dehydrogenase
VLRYYGGAVDKFGGRTIPVDGGIDMTFPEPVGPVAVIVPWNFPLAIATWKIAPTLAAGNVVLVKPSEMTPLTMMELLALSEEAGFPPAVIQLLNGPGSTVGAALVADPRVRKVSFTGSTDVGRQIAIEAGSQLKVATLELGGKSASLVFADADLSRAAREAPAAVFGNSGQDCCARSRVLVERSVLDEFLSMFVEESAKFVVGDPTDEATSMGPLISQQHRERVQSFIDGELIFQGQAPEGDGFWYPPTILGPMSNDCRPAQEEIFGPVAVVIPFETEDEAVRLANDTRYGLSGSIWSENGAKAIRVARDLSLGTVSINSNNSVRPSTPFGGVKESGHGREMGMEALNWCTAMKNVFFDTRT